MTADVHVIKRIKKINVKLDDKDYSLSVPSMDQLEPVFNVDKDNATSLVKMQKDLLINMGLPEDIVSGLGFYEANQFMELLTGSLKKV